MRYLFSQKTRTPNEFITEHWFSFQWTETWKRNKGVMMSFKCLSETHQCAIIISSKPRQRRRRRDQAASVIARRPLTAAAGDVRTAPRLGCCRRSGGNGGSGGNTAGSTAQTSHFSFFLSLLASRSLCGRSFAWCVTVLPFSPSPAPFSPFPSPYIPLSN